MDTHTVHFPKEDMDFPGRPTGRRLWSHTLLFHALFLISFSCPRTVCLSGFGGARTSNAARVMIKKFWIDRNCIDSERGELS